MCDPPVLASLRSRRDSPSTQEIKLHTPEPVLGQSAPAVSDDTGL